MKKVALDRRHDVEYQGVVKDEDRRFVFSDADGEAKYLLRRRGTKM